MMPDFSSYGIGLGRGEVKLVPHQDSWKDLFNIESTRLLAKAFLPEFKLHHIGSTSIIGIQAKPIIDILGEIDRIEKMDQIKDTFMDLGYEYKGEYGIAGRRYLTLYSEDKTTAFVHLHIFESSNEKFAEHLLFRDILNSNVDLRLRYENLKVSLVKKGIPRENYSDAKADLIREIIASKKIPDLD